MKRPRTTPVRIGILLVVATLLTFVVLFSKDRIATTLAHGDTVSVHFARDYKLRPFVSKVKVGFVPVGRVSGVDRAADGSAVVRVKVDRDVLRTLGSEPTATIRPTTVLGGSYFVDLKAGGDPGPFRGDDIPQSRTTLPVELDKVVRALQPDALDGAKAGVDHLDRFARARGERAFARLVGSAPAAMRPAATVLDAAQGVHRTRDLGELASGLETTGRVLTADQGRLDRILVHLRTTTATLDRRSTDLGAALETMAGGLRTVRGGMDSLRGTLGSLQEVSSRARPTATELRRTLDRLDPVLVRARPVVGDLRAAVHDARPVLGDAVPSARSARGVLGDLRGPVLDRINGPVVDWLYEPFHGRGRYALTSTKKPLYEEITYALVDLDRASSMSDPNGHAVSFQPGIGAGSVGGLPLSLEQYTKAMTTWYYRDQPLNTIPSVPGAGGSLNGLLGALMGGKK